jgi:hypothetical protein
LFLYCSPRGQSRKPIPDLERGDAQLFSDDATWRVVSKRKRVRALQIRHDPASRGSFIFNNKTEAPASAALNNIIAAKKTINTDMIALNKIATASLLCLASLPHSRRAVNLKVLMRAARGEEQARHSQEIHHQFLGFIVRNFDLRNVEAWSQA